MKFVQGKTVKEKFFNGQNIPLAPSHLLPQLLYLSRIATTYYASGTMFFYEIVKLVIFSTPLLLMYLSYYCNSSLSSTFLKKFYLLLQEFFCGFQNHRLNLPTAFPYRHAYHTTVTVGCQYFFENIFIYTFTKARKAA